MNTFWSYTKIDQMNTSLQYTKQTDQMNSFCHIKNRQNEYFHRDSTGVFLLLRVSVSYSAPRDRHRRSAC